MKIRDLKVFIVGNPPPGFGGRYFIFVKLTTDDNVSGIGEVYCDTFGPKAMTAMKGGQPPQLSVLLSTDVFTLMDENAIVPMDDLVADKAWDRLPDEATGVLEEAALDAIDEATDWAGDRLDEMKGWLPG